MNLDAYLREVRKLWPQHIFFYKEELALMYLAFKSYQVDKALISIYTCADELLQLITLEYNREKVSQKNNLEYLFYRKLTLDAGLSLPSSARRTSQRTPCNNWLAVLTTPNLW